MGDIKSVAVSALDAGGIRLAVTANNVANMNTEGFRPSTVVQEENKTGGGRISAIKEQGSDEVDLSREAVELIITEAGFKANIKVLQADEEMIKSLLDIKA